MEELKEYNNNVVVDSVEEVVPSVPEFTLNNANIIRNISTDQKEILYNIMKLYNDGKPFDCDITASTLNFYKKKKSDKYEIPEPKYLFDVFPQCDKVVKIEPFKSIPLPDNSIHSIVVDLPFVIAPVSKSFEREGSNLIAKRFSSWYPYMEAYKNFTHWISECYRVLDDGGIIVYKMQDTVSGSITHSFVSYAKLCAWKLNMYVIDEFILQAKARLINPKKYKRQCHARKYTSSFLVIKKDKHKGVKFNPLNIYEQVKEELNNNSINN